MEREKLRTSGRTLYMSLLLPDRRPTVTDHTHVHVEGTTKARGVSDYYIRILSSYDPTVMVVFETRALRDAAMSRLKEAKFNFGTDTVHRAMVKTWAYPPYGDYTMFSLSIKANDSLYEVYQALWPFFENKGYVPAVNVALDAVHPPLVLSNRLFVTQTLRPRLQTSLQHYQTLRKRGREPSCKARAASCADHTKAHFCNEMSQKTVG